jgi:hypothetical protein
MRQLRGGLVNPVPGLPWRLPSPEAGKPIGGRAVLKSGAASSTPSRWRSLGAASALAFTSGPLGRRPRGRKPAPGLVTSETIGGEAA